MAEILVVDDEIGIRELLSEILGDEGHSVHTAENAEQARFLCEENPLDLVLLDIWMPDTDGITLLKEWAAAGKLTMPVIMMSGHATIDTAVEATRIGALDFLEKPITMQKLLRAVETGLQRGSGAVQAGGGAVSAGVAAPAPVPATAPTGAAAVGTGVGGAGVAGNAGIGRAGTTGVVEAVTGPVATVTDGPEAGAGAGPAAEPGAAQHPAASNPASVTLRELPLDLPLREARDAFERTYFEYHLGREQGSMTRVAERTGLERTHLYRKLKQLGIDLSRGLWRRGGG